MSIVKHMPLHVVRILQYLGLKGPCRLAMSCGHGFVFAACARICPIAWKDVRDGVGHRFRWPGLRGPPLFFLAVISTEGYELALSCFISFCRCQDCFGDPSGFDCCDMLLCIRRSSFRYLVALHAAALHEPPVVLGARRIITPIKRLFSSMLGVLPSCHAPCHFRL